MPCKPWCFFGIFFLSGLDAWWFYFCPLKLQVHVLGTGSVVMWESVVCKYCVSGWCSLWLRGHGDRERLLLAAWQGRGVWILALPSSVSSLGREVKLALFSWLHTSSGKDLTFVTKNDWVFCFLRSCSMNKQPLSTSTLPVCLFHPSALGKLKWE